MSISSFVFAAESATAVPVTSPIMVDARGISFDAYFISDRNYIRLRDFAYVLNGTSKQFDVILDDTNKAININKGNPYTVIGTEMKGKNSEYQQAVPTTSKIYIDGVEINLTGYNIEGSSYFGLRDLCRAMDVYVGGGSGFACVF